MKKWKVIMTDTAKNDLREIALGIYELSGDSDTTVNFVMELEDRCTLLESQPESGALYAEFAKFAVFHEKYRPAKSIRTSMADYKDEGWLINLPLWAVENI